MTRQGVMTRSGSAKHGDDRDARYFLGVCDKCNFWFDIHCVNKNANDFCLHNWGFFIAINFWKTFMN